MDFDFETTFGSDDEVTAAFDEFVDSVRGSIERDEQKVTMLNAKRMEQLQFTYAVMKYLTKDTDAKLSYKLYEPFKTMGSVSAEGELLEFDKPEWFAQAAAFASNIEVYPLTNNKVRLTFTFHGLTAPIE
jgi:hypothetical protein